MRRLFLWCSLNISYRLVRGIEITQPIEMSVQRKLRKKIYAWNRRQENGSIWNLRSLTGSSVTIWFCVTSGIGMQMTVISDPDWEQPSSSLHPQTQPRSSSTENLCKPWRDRLPHKYDFKRSIFLPNRPELRHLISMRMKVPVGDCAERAASPMDDPKAEGEEHGVHTYSLSSCGDETKDRRDFFLRGGAADERVLVQITFSVWTQRKAKHLAAKLLKQNKTSTTYQTYGIISRSIWIHTRNYTKPPADAHTHTYCGYTNTSPLQK